MLYGITINSTDTLSTYGLMLCADLKIGQPKLKANRVNIPGGDGSLNMSYSPQGMAVFEDRTISGTLFKAVGEADRDDLVVTLRNAWHGQEVNLTLPNDTTHYWHGVIEFGEVSGYNKGNIPFTMTAAPYRLKSTETTVSKAISTSGTVTLTNERMPVCPTVTTTAAVTLAWGDYSVSINAGTHTIPQLVLGAGSTTITVTGSATVTFVYREGSL